MADQKRQKSNESSIWLGVLPFIGVILFVLSSLYLLFGNHTNWRHQLLLNGVIYMIGWAGIGAGIAHVFASNSISKSIGFEKSPFEKEVGFIGFALGITALLASSYSIQYWLAVILISSIFRILCGFLHVKEILTQKNYAVNNVGILFVDFVVPIFLILIYWAWA